MWQRINSVKQYHEGCLAGGVGAVVRRVKAIEKKGGSAVLKYRRVEHDHPIIEEMIDSRKDNGPVRDTEPARKIVHLINERGKKGRVVKCNMMQYGKK